MREDLLVHKVGVEAEAALDVVHVTIDGKATTAVFFLLQGSSM